MNSQQRNKFASQSSLEHRWIISYADFMTLLFAFFVFLFSISTIEKDKFEQVSQTLLQIFDVKPTAVKPIELNATPQGPDVFNPLFEPEPLQGKNIDMSDSEVYQKESSLLDIQAKINDQFDQIIKDKLFSVSGSDSWIEIEIADSIIFSSGSADINNEAESILYEIGKLLSTNSLPVAIEGRVSLAEMSELDAAGGWRLSSERAANVLRYIERSGVSGERLSAVAFSGYQPKWVVKNNTIVGQASVSIVVAGFKVGIR